MKAVIIPAEGEPRLVEVPLDEYKSLKVLQEAVGGYIERIRITDTMDMWCNEEYRITIPSPPVNKIATSIYIMFRRGDYILGDVIFTGSTDQEGNITSLTEMEVHVLMSVRRVEASHKN